MDGTNYCGDGENVVKGLLDETYDPVSRIALPKLFKGKESSYSRLRELDLHAIWVIFLKELHHPDREPPKNLIGYAILNVGKMRRIAREYRNPETKENVKLEMLPMPTDTNRAHAVTVPSVPSTLAQVISSTCIDSIGTAA